MNSNSSKKKQPQVYTNNLLESLRDIPGGVGKAVVRDVAGGIANDALASLFGAAPKTSGELRPGQEIPLGQEAPPQPQMRPEFSQRAPVRVEEQGLKQKIEAVRAELKALAESIKQLNTQIDKTVNEVPVDPGVYHLNFFERLKTTLKLMRQQIDDSRSWLTLSTSRRKQRGYWRMYKKHGTSFGLSNERTVATQAG